jgi:cytochrome b
MRLTEFLRQLKRNVIMASDKKIVSVWDPLVRIGHWTLVIAFFTAYFTEDDLMQVHTWAGYTVAAVVLIRIVWGFVGSKHARFSDFIYAPAKVLAYLKNLLARKPQHYIGHNPAGGAMAIALLLSLAGTTFTGMKLYAVEENEGPFAITTQQAQTHMDKASIISSAKADEEEEDDDEKSEGANNGHVVDEQAEEYWEELHETFTNLTLLLVFLHIGGVIFSSIVDKEKLAKAMITGKKEIDDSYQ